jgi:hypothetical protein
MNMQARKPLSLEDANRLLIHPGEEPMTALQWKLVQAFGDRLRNMRDGEVMTREQAQAYIDGLLDSANYQG